MRPNVALDVASSVSSNVTCYGRYRPKLITRTVFENDEIDKKVEKLPRFVRLVKLRYRCRVLECSRRL